MRTGLTLTVVFLTMLTLSTAAASGLAASRDRTALPSALVGRWSKTVPHADWLKTGRDFPTTKVTIVVDGAGRQVGYFGPDYTPPSVTPNAGYPDWYTDWKVGGAKMTIGAVPPCGWVDSWSGRYRWSVAGSTLRLTKLADRCPDRIAIFAGTWKKVR